MRDTYPTFLRCVLGVVGILLLLGRTSAQQHFVIPDARLSALKPDEPAAYRDLAEELSVIDGSRKARDLTIRLYLICAAHSNGELKRSALRGLIFSARDEREKKNLTVLAYLQDDQFSEMIRSDESSSLDQTDPENSESPVDAQLLVAIRSLRQGKNKYKRALKIMESVAVRERLVQLNPGFTVEQFEQACKSEKLSDQMLLSVLELDAQIRGLNQSQSPDPESNDSLDSWRLYFKKSLPPRLPEIDFRTVTEFNPSQTVYRNGVWRTPVR